MASHAPHAGAQSARSKGVRISSSSRVLAAWRTRGKPRFFSAHAPATARVATRNTWAPCGRRVIMLVAQRNDVARTARVFLMGRRSRLVFCVPRRQSAGFMRVFCSFLFVYSIKKFNKNTEQNVIWGRHPNTGERVSRFAFCWCVSIRSSRRGASAKTTQKNAIEATKNPPSFPSLFFFFLFCSTPMAKKPPHEPKHPPPFWGLLFLRPTALFCCSANASRAQAAGVGNRVRRHPASACDEGTRPLDSPRRAQ